MKNVALAVGALAVIALVVGLVGRFLGDPLVHLVGQAHAASSFLSLANTLLLLGIFLLLVEPAKR